VRLFDSAWFGLDKLHREYYPSIYEAKGVQLWPRETKIGAIVKSR